MLRAEAREHPRAKARVKVEYHFGSTTSVGHTSDISEGGMFLSSKTAIARPGTRVYLRVHVPGSRSGDPLKIIGFVTRAVESGDARDAAGMGIHFEVAYARTREQLADFLDGLRAHGHDPPAPTIKALGGGDDGAATFSARFPDPPQADYQRHPTLRPREVERVFAFDAPEALPVDWAKLATLGLKIALVIAVLCAIGYVLVSVAGTFSGVR
jgi:hypothetical protein